MISLKKMDGWKKYDGKKVFVKLKNGRSYSGEIVEVEEKGSYVFVTMLDKFKKRVSFYATEISVIEEEDN